MSANADTPDSLILSMISDFDFVLGEFILSINRNSQDSRERIEQKREGFLSLPMTLALGYVIGATMTFSQVMPTERATDVTSQTLNMARAMIISLTWPAYWGLRLSSN